MKRFHSYFLSTVFFVVLALPAIITSCSSTTTYADQLDEEKAIIKSYIKRMNINVLGKYPEYPQKWGENDYVHTPSGFYIHLVDSGECHPGDTLAADTGDLVIPRFYEYTLTLPVDTTISNWTTNDYPFPTTFTYGNTSGLCAAMREAIVYMRYNNARVKMIIPSKYGFYSSSSDVIPYGYDLKITVQKRYY